MWSKLAQERKFALAWLVSEASYVEREVQGVRLQVGETPAVSLAGLEARFNWTPKAARLFLEYALSAKCADETGIRIRRGRRVQGHPQGHSEGHPQGHTYLIGLVRFAIGEGHPQGHSEGHPQGHSKEEKDVREGKNSLPTGEKKPRTRGGRTVPADWHPTPQQEQELRSIAVQRGADYGEQMVMLRDHEFPRPYTDWYKVALNWMRRANPSSNGRASGNGRYAGRTDRDAWRYRAEGVSVADGDASIVPDDYGE
jgi:hypothetical protein